MRNNTLTFEEAATHTLIIHGAPKLIEDCAHVGTMRELARLADASHRALFADVHAAHLKAERKVKRQARQIARLKAGQA